MSSHGKVETEKLIENVEGQLDRLVQQLQDLEECRDELDPVEYLETKEETMEQLKELNGSLVRLTSGDVSLVSSVSAIQLALRAAISEAFQTPEVIRLFGKRQPEELRQRLQTIKEGSRLHKLPTDVCDRQQAEILLALQQLGEKLSPNELLFLEQQSSVDLSKMEELANEH